MCAVSAILEYGMSLPETWWDRQRVSEFQKLVDQAKAFDVDTNQADCEDPEKAKFLQRLMKQVDG